MRDTSPFSDAGKILISGKLSCCEQMGINEGMSIRSEKLNDKHREYIDYHRSNIFKDDY